MNKQPWIAAIAAVVLGASSLSAMAQPGHAGPGPRPGHGGPHYQYQHPAPPPPAVRPGKPAHPHGMPPGQAKKRMGAGPQHKWVKGTRLPYQYRTPHYVVNDWRHHGLKQPPRGYQWVQYGSDYMLVAIASGIISQLILGY